MYICIYVYMSLCIYMFTYLYMYICIYAYMYICIYVYLHILLNEYMYTCSYMCMYVKFKRKHACGLNRAWIYGCMFVCICRHAQHSCLLYIGGEYFLYVRMHIHVYVHAYSGMSIFIYV